MLQSENSAPFAVSWGSARTPVHEWKLLRFQRRIDADEFNQTMQNITRTLRKEEDTMEALALLLRDWKPDPDWLTRKSREELFFVSLRAFAVFLACIVVIKLFFFLRSCDGH